MRTGVGACHEPDAADLDRLIALPAAADMIPSVLVAEPEPCIGPALRSVDLSEHVEVVHECTSAAQVLEVLDPISIDVAIVDAGLEGGGIDLVAQMSRRHPSLPIAVATKRESQSQLLEVIRCGGRGYLGRRLMVRLLPDVVFDLAAGGVVLRARHIARLVDELVGRGPSSTLGDFARLSDRESEIVKRVTDGESPAEIGLAIGVSELTARRHIAAALRRHDTIDRAQTERLLLELDDLPLRGPRQVIGGSTPA